MFVSVEGLYDSMSMNQIEAGDGARRDELTAHVAVVRPSHQLLERRNESALSGCVVNLLCDSSGAVWKGLPGRSSSEWK